jgi:hypothetical protein
MATRQHRIADFDSDGDPPTGYRMELLCEDHNGTYVLPFPCLWVDARGAAPDLIIRSKPKSLAGEGNKRLACTRLRPRGQ